MHSRKLHSRSNEEKLFFFCHMHSVSAVPLMFGHKGRSKPFTHATSTRFRRSVTRTSLLCNRMATDTGLFDSPKTSTCPARSLTVEVLSEAHHVARGNTRKTMRYTVWTTAASLVRHWSHIRSLNIFCCPSTRLAICKSLYLSIRSSGYFQIGSHVLPFTCLHLPPWNRMKTYLPMHVHSVHLFCMSVGLYVGLCVRLSARQMVRSLFS